MRTRWICLSCLTCLSLAMYFLLGFAQSSPSAQQLPSSTVATKQTLDLHLTPIESISTSEVATSFAGPFFCDGDANLYLRSEPAGVSAIRKLDAKGERVALYQPSANPDVSVGVVGPFWVTRDGEVYILAFAKNELSRYVLVFTADGNYKSKIKLDPGFPWIPNVFAVFPNGSLLVSGQAHDRDPKAPNVAFTGIFRADGKLLKEVNLEDDSSIHDMALAHDPRVMSAAVPSSNQAISWSQIDSAKDGNLYLMRWLSPAVFYAISPSGQVVRRFTVDPGNPDYKPIVMHVSGNRIAVLFFQPQTMDKTMKVVDLEGQPLASYDELRQDGKAKLGLLGLAFACYTYPPDRFIFLGTDDNHNVQLKSAGAR